MSVFGLDSAGWRLLGNAFGALLMSVVLIGCDGAINFVDSDQSLNDPVNSTPVNAEPSTPSDSDEDEPSNADGSQDLPIEQSPEGSSPVGETPQIETPQIETPQTETPQIETPQTETPQTETPQTETPQTEAPEEQIDTPIPAPPIESPDSEEPVDTEQPPEDHAEVCAAADHVDDRSALIFNEFDYSQEPKPAADQIRVVDYFGRSINQYGINLIDWQGYLANPFVRLNISGPENARYPLQVELSALGTSRLMLSKPSTLSAFGANATRTLQSAADSVEVLLAIHPDRGGEFAIENYEFNLASRDANGVRQSLTLPIRVLDQDEYFEAPSIPIKIDTRYDNLGTGHFKNPEILAAATQAINDWFYFFDIAPFDPVGAEQESLWLAGVDWQNHETVRNNESFTGMWVFLRSFSGPYSTGYPAANGQYHRRQGEAVAGQIHRSVTHILHFYEDAQVFTSLDDELWYLSEIHKVTDVYGLVMHEFGHAIAMHSYWSGMANYQQREGQNAEHIIDYQGTNVPLDNTYHIPNERSYWDRLSGQSGGWEHLFPTRRWMNTKLSLLIAEQAGWPINRKLTPFLPLSISTESLPEAKAGCGYRYSLAAQGGVPFYDWQVIAGRLPEGFVLDRYTGTLNAATITAPAGDYQFTVQLQDADERTEPVIQELSLHIK